MKCWQAMFEWAYHDFTGGKKEKPDTKGIQIQQEFTFLFCSVLSRIYLLGQPVLHGGRWEV